jgi:hypothetical protein
MLDWLLSRVLAYEINVPLTGDKKTYGTFKEYFLDLIKFAINIASALAVLMIVYGAFKYATSGGDENKAKDGKDIIVGALVGFGLLLLIRVLIPLLGLQ